MNLPPLQFSSTAASRADSGALTASAMFDNSGFSVNYGSGVSQGGTTPTINPLWAGAALVAVWLWKKHSA
jgi:hypothetical protein